MIKKYLKPVLGFCLSFALAACQVSTVNQSDSSPVVVENPPVEEILNDDVTVIVEPELEPSDEEIVHNSLWERIGAGLTLYEQYSHPAIDNELEWYIDNQVYFDQIAARASPFLFWIVEKVESRNLPLELALVPVVESAFNPHAYSSEHAAGLWQFIAPTARSFGLQKDWWYDGRQDPLASTEAALDYFEMLFTKFDNDWLLALAAYNAGEGNIRRAIRRNQKSNKSTAFWDLPLPEETKSHVPRILAVAKLIANSSEFGVNLPEIPNEAFLDIVEFDFQIDIDHAAKVSSLDPELLKTLNPGYLQWATHPDKPQFLVVPINQAMNFRNSVTAVPVDQRVTWDRYEISPGDTLTGIAGIYDTSVDVLQKVNNLKNTRIIAGRSLMIPRTTGIDQFSLPSLAFQEDLPRQAVPAEYRIRRGDNLWSIARRFDLHSKDIADLNNLNIDSLLRPGQILNLLTPKFVAGINISNTGSSQRINYPVKKGDSLAKIAGKFGVSIDDIVSWNNLNPRALIFPGQEIEVFIPGTEFN